MTSAPPMYAPTSEAGSRKFIVNMMAALGQEPRVRSCEVTQKQFKNRLSFNSALSIQDVFSKDVAAVLQDCVSKLSLREAEVIALPSLVLDVPGLVLGGAQIIAMKGDDDTLSILFRFRFFLGGINQVFSPNIGFDDFSQDQNVATSASVLEDIAMPLLDLCTAAEAGLIDAGIRMGEFGKSLSERSHEIKFQIELIKRYVVGLENARSRKVTFTRDDLMAEAQRQVLSGVANDVPAGASTRSG